MVEIRKYRDCVNVDFEQDSSVPPVYSDKVKIVKKKDELPLTYNPFTDEEEYLPSFGDLLQIEFDKQRSIRNSFKRTIQEIYKYSRQVNWEYFITLTFDGAKTDRYDFDACMKKAHIWFYHQRLRYANDLKYLYVPEMHQDGAWHIHGVIADVGNMKIKDSGRVSIGGKAYVRNEHNSQYPTIYNLSGWKNGWSTATVVNDVHKVSTYITKYITKELCAVTKNKRRYYRSRNITEPKETTFVVEGTPAEKEEFIQTLVDSLGVDLIYKKSFSGIYQAVDYRYYQ